MKQDRGFLWGLQELDLRENIFRKWGCKSTFFVWLPTIVTIYPSHCMCLCYTCCCFSMYCLVVLVGMVVSLAIFSGTEYWGIILVIWLSPWFLPLGIIALTLGLSAVIVTFSGGTGAVLLIPLVIPPILFCMIACAVDCWPCTLNCCYVSNLFCCQSGRVKKPNRYYITRSQLNHYFDRCRKDTPQDGYFEVKCTKSYGGGEHEASYTVTTHHATFPIELTTVVDKSYNPVPKEEDVITNGICYLDCVYEMEFKDEDLERIEVIRNELKQKNRHYGSTKVTFHPPSVEHINVIMDPNIETPTLYYNGEEVTLEVLNVKRNKKEKKGDILSDKRRRRAFIFKINGEKMTNEEVREIEERYFPSELMIGLPYRAINDLTELKIFSSIWVTLCVPLYCICCCSCLCPFFFHRSFFKTLFHEYGSSFDNNVFESSDKRPNMMLRIRKSADGFAVKDESLPPPKPVLTIAPTYSFMNDAAKNEIPNIDQASPQQQQQIADFTDFGGQNVPIPLYNNNNQVVVGNELPPLGQQQFFGQPQQQNMNWERNDNKNPEAPEYTGFNPNNMMEGSNIPPPDMGINPYE